MYEMKERYGREYPIYLPKYVIDALEKNAIATIHDNKWGVSPYLGTTLTVYRTRKGYAVIASEYTYGRGRAGEIAKVPAIVYTAFEVSTDELEKALRHAGEELWVRAYEEAGEAEKAREAEERVRRWAEESALAIRDNDLERLMDIELVLPERLQVAVGTYVNRKITWTKP